MAAVAATADSLCRNSINISRSVICVLSCPTRWHFILSGWISWPTAVSTSALTSSSLSSTMLSVFRLRRSLSCSAQKIGSLLAKRKKIKFPAYFNVVFSWKIGSGYENNPRQQKSTCHALKTMLDNSHRRQGTIINDPTARDSPPHAALTHDKLLLIQKEV
jgi:hypothetical protein